MTFVFNIFVGILALIGVFTLWIVVRFWWEIRRIHEYLKDIEKLSDECRRSCHKSNIILYTLERSYSKFLDQEKKGP